LNTAVGKWFNQSNGLGRLWAPMVEFLAHRNLQDGAIRLAAPVVVPFPTGS
jgi:hypothetical protein